MKKHFYPFDIQPTKETKKSVQSTQHCIGFFPKNEKKSESCLNCIKEKGCPTKKGKEVVK